jgi:hypothetical protein
LTIGLVRNQSTTQRDFLPGYQGIGVILSFTVVILLFGTGLVLFFLPYLTFAAETGYGMIKIAAKPLGPILVSVLRFIFLHGTLRSEESSPPTKGSIGDLVSPTESSWWVELLEKILAWVFGGIFGLIVLTISGLALFFLFRWLLSRAPISERRQSTWDLISLWVEKLRIFLLSCYRWVIRKVKGYKGAAQLYTALLSWGRCSGLPHFLSETPIEYGLRLKNGFPSLKREIELIIEAFNQEVYGEIILNEKQLAMTKSAWRRLRSPRNWPSRLKTWFIRPVE